MKTSNTKLNAAKSNRDDEFYTQRCDVEKIYNKFSQFYDMSKITIDLPFDSEASEFYKVAKERGWNVNIDGNFDYKNFKYSKNGVVISNPPFSLIREIVEYYVLHKIKFLLVAPLNFFSSRQYVEFFNKRIVHFDHVHIDWFLRPDGRLSTVKSNLVHNLDSNYKPEFWIANGGWKPENNFNDWDNDFEAFEEQTSLFETEPWKAINKAGLEPGLKRRYYTIRYVFTEYAHIHRNIAFISFIRKSGKESFLRLYHLV